MSTIPIRGDKLKGKSRTARYQQITNIGRVHTVHAVLPKASLICLLCGADVSFALLVFLVLDFTYVCNRQVIFSQNYERTNVFYPCKPRQIQLLPTNATILTFISIGGTADAVAFVRSVKNVSKLSKAVSPSCFNISSGSAFSPSFSSVSPPTMFDSSACESSPRDVAMCCSCAAACPPAAATASWNYGHSF